MVEKESSTEGPNIPRSESPSEILNKAYRDLFGDFCAIKADEKTKAIKYGKNTPKDGGLMGLAIQLEEGKLDPEDEKQKKQLTSFFDNELKKHPADKEPEEHLKIQKLKLITLHGRKWLESDQGKEHIEKIKQADGLEALEREKTRYTALIIVQEEQSVLEERGTAAEEKRKSEREKESPEEALSEILSPEAIRKNVDLASVKILLRRMKGWDMDSLNLEAINRTSQEIERIEIQASARLQSQAADTGNADKESLRRYEEISRSVDLLYEILARKEAELNMNTTENPSLLSELAADRQSAAQEEILGPRNEAAQEFKKGLLELVTPEKDEDGNITIKNAQLRKRIESLVSPYNIANASSLQSSLEQINKLSIEGQVPPEEADALCLVIYQQLQRLREMQLNPYAGDLPEFLGAAFYYGSNNAAIESGQIRKDRNYIYHVENPSERLKWLLRNVGRFSRGIRITNPQDVWQDVYNRWMGDFDSAIETREKIGESLPSEEINPFKTKIQSFMGVASAARAMEFSAGSAESYTGAIAGYRNGKLFLDAKDYFAPWTLQSDESKMVTVLSEPLIAHYYEMILERAGVVMPDTFHPINEDGKRIYSELEPEKVDDMKLTKWDYRIDRSRIFEDEEDKDGNKKLKKDGLAYYLKEEGGFDSFIEDVLMKEGKKSSKDENNEKGPKDENNKEFEGSEKWAAAKMACDAFLTGVYTKWAIIINPENKYWLRPSPRDGGDPFRCILEPGFLPFRIKKVYRDGTGPEIINLVNEAFCPNDLFCTNLRAPAVDKATELILTALPYKEKKELDQLSADKIRDLVSDAIEKIRPLLDGVAKEDGTYFKEGTDPWKVIGDKISEKATYLLLTDQKERKEGQAITIKFSPVLWLRETIKEVTAKAASVCDVDQLDPTAMLNLKKYYRYASGLMSVLGDSRASSLSEWSDEIIGNLDKAVELIDAVYGSNDKEKDGKHLVGLMVARIIKAKVVASALERAKPDWKEKISQIFNFPSATIESFQQAEQALFGPDINKIKGKIGGLMGARRSIVIMGNKYGAEEEIERARQALRDAQGLSSKIMGSRATASILKSIGENIY